MPAPPTLRARPLPPLLPMLRVFATLLALAALRPSPAAADPVSVHHVQGTLHGFLALHTLDGKLLGAGDLLQSVHGDRVTSRLVFHFKDGSVQDETVVFSQHATLRVLKDHLVQRGPAFPHPMDLTVDGATGRVMVETTGEDGKAQRFEEHLDLPPDLANGMISTLLQELPHEVQQTTVSLVVAAPKPRLVKLRISRAGTSPFTVAGSARSAAHFVIHVEIGGIAGLLAPLVGKQPPDSHVWVLADSAPIFLRAEQPFFLGAPLWRIDLTGPSWPQHHP